MCPNRRNKPPRDARCFIQAEVSVPSLSTAPEGKPSSHLLVPSTVTPRPGPILTPAHCPAHFWMQAPDSSQPSRPHTDSFCLFASPREADSPKQGSPHLPSNPMCTLKALRNAINYSNNSILCTFIASFIRRSLEYS